jgi:apolipoprotein D and lipocalin family protein
MKNTFIPISILLAALFPACQSHAPLAVVPEVKLQQYKGLWYEIASFPQSFQKGCSCTTAEYRLEKDYVRVINRCWKAEKEEWDVAKGKAFVTPNSNNAKLKVQFFWPFRGKYWIIELASDYSWAVVGHPNRDYLWILSRKPQMEEEVYNDLLKRVEEKGFDVSRLKITEQLDCPD